MPRHSALSVLGSLLLFPAVLALVAALYWPASSGGLQFDDRGNLDGLARITDATSAENFIFSGTAGPLGRPIALASFALQAHAWPESPQDFLQANILIHLLNGALVAWAMLWLSRLRRIPEREAAQAAVAGAALWLVMPLLASSSLFIVQRMATLSASFMLAGLTGYLAARSRLEEAPTSALFGMSASLVVGTLLAVLTKESGALLPVLVLTIELTLQRGVLFLARRWTARAWAIVFLVAPLLVLLGFLWTQVPYSDSIEARRGFTAEQRLWTESRILWEYLVHAFLPTPQRLAPFHDHIQHSGSVFEPVTLLAVSGWAGAILVALAVRRQSMLPAFAVCWYLAAHLLESTVLNLELYFAHRNYVALIGPIYALAAAAWTLRKPAARLARGLLVAYTLVMALVLYQFTTLWGQPDLAAEMWAIHRTESIRANQHLASRLQEQRYHAAALRVLDEIHRRDPVANAPTGIQALTLACAMRPYTDHGDRVSALLGQLPGSRFELNVPASLQQLHDVIRREPCEGVSGDAVRSLALAVLENPLYSRSSLIAHNLHNVLAELAVEDRDFARTMHHVEQSLRIMASLESLHTGLRLLIDAGLPEKGYELIGIVRSRTPRHPIQRRQWEATLQQFEHELGLIIARETDHGNKRDDAHAPRD